VTNDTTSASNLGPSWGYRTIIFWEAVLPRWLFNFLLGIGTFIGLLITPRRRRYAADYWLTLTHKPPSLWDQYRHYRSFMESLVLKLQAGRGKLPTFYFAPKANKDTFIALCHNPEPALFGTFHVGHSDMMGCMLKDFNRRVAMVRHRVGNSEDTDILASSFSNNLRFLWINDPTNFIFQLKEAIQQGESIALQCDRTEFSSKKASFRFLGEDRAFPMTIYFLADLFKCPVVFSFTGPLEKFSKIAIYTSRVFHPNPDRKKSMEKAKRHFQEVLYQLENHLKRHPDLWFNFSPLSKGLDEESPSDD